MIPAMFFANAGCLQTKGKKKKKKKSISHDFIAFGLNH
jgi:hypothetical protein